MLLRGHTKTRFHLYDGGHKNFDFGVHGVRHDVIIASNSDVKENGVEMFCFDDFVFIVGAFDRFSTMWIKRKGFYQQIEGQRLWK